MTPVSHGKPCAGNPHARFEEGDSAQAEPRRSALLHNKPSMKYRVVQGRNPRTGGTIQRPQIVDRETYHLDQVVEYALNAGYVRGQFHDMRGALNGFIEAIQQLGRDGKAVNLNNWLRVHAELTGQVGESRQLSSANELHVVITALQDLKSDWTKFSWTNVEDSGVIPKIDTILSPGGKPWEVVKTRGILVTGRNLYFDAAKGDTATISWGEGASAQTINVTPTENDYSHLLFAWPTALADVDAGTKLTFSFRTCAGIEGGAVYPMTKQATLVAAS